MPKDEINLTVRLPSVLHIELVRAAKAEHRSLNAQIIHLLEVIQEPR